LNRVKQSPEGEQVSFDDYVDTYQKEIQYSIGFIGKDVDFFLRLKADKLIELANKYLNDTNITVLDIGSGVGLMDSCLTNTFKNLYGVDVEEAVVLKAKEHNPSVNYRLYDGNSLPFPDNSIDLVFAVNVMHHVPPANWNNFVKEMYRVTKKGRLAVVFEHNPYNPLTRLAVSRCEFDRDAVLLKKNKLKELFVSSGFEIAEHAYIIFFPFKSKFFRSIEQAVRWLPFGAQHYIAGKKK